MTYEELQYEDMAQLQAFMDVFRPLMGECARLFARIERLEDAWKGGVDDIVASLDDNGPIRATTGFMGAGVLTKENVSQSMADFQQALAGFYAEANRQSYIRAAGLGNTL